MVKGSFIVDSVVMITEDLWNTFDMHFIHLSSVIFLINLHCSLRNNSFYTFQQPK